MGEARAAGLGPAGVALRASVVYSLAKISKPHPGSPCGQLLLLVLLLFAESHRGRQHRCSSLHWGFTTARTSVTPDAGLNAS